VLVLEQIRGCLLRETVFAKTALVGHGTGTSRWELVKGGTTPMHAIYAGQPGPKIADSRSID